jgi:hypothetical protein
MNLHETTLVTKLEYRGDVVSLLKTSGTHWFATGRFGLDLLLDKPINALDFYSIYVPKPESETMISHLEKYGGTRNPKLPELPNVAVIATKEYDQLCQALDEYVVSAPQKYLSGHKATSNSSRNMQKYPKQTDYKKFLEMISKHKGIHHNHSLGDTYPHLINLARLGEDLRTLAPRYKKIMYDHLPEALKS